MNRRRDGLALLSLSGLAVLFLWRLALTDLIIGRGDLFFYFYPYRDFASAAVRAGQVPFWNPYLFMGAPFLANSQVGFFYPLNLALALRSWPVAQTVNANLVLHVGIAAWGGYFWGRGALALSRPAAWLTGLCYGLGGYFLAQVEHLNQVQVLAWLPWMLWVANGESRLVGLALILAMQFLAGHTQSVFICLVGAAGYVGLPLAWDALRRRARWRALVGPAGWLLGAALFGGGLAAAQLFPTWELTQLSVRSGGLPYKQAVSFSLRPGLLGRALLPGWGATLFPEFVAYVGVLGLALVVVGGVAAARTNGSTGTRNSRRGALVLVGLGVFLALGGFNPFYFLLVKLVPGFGLFRAPARWLALYAIGASGLAGLGLERLCAEMGGRATGERWRVGWGIAGGILALLVFGGQLFGSAEPDLAPRLTLWPILGWSLAVFALFVFASRRRKNTPRPALFVSFVLVLVVCELFAASLFLPLNRATAPGALTNLRPAVAYLLAEADATDSGPPARFLSISDILFDPGDKPEIEIALGPQLSADALYDFLIATKQKEVLIPNLPLYFRLPAVDGYDGGVLPLRRYVTLERLYMPEEQVAIDGRLRENLASVPDGRWLNLFNVRFIVTDKVGDAWFDRVFYDLQMGARLTCPGGPPALHPQRGAGECQEAEIGYVPPLEATALGVVYRADGAEPGTLLAEIDVTFAHAQRTLGLYAEAEATTTGDRVARLRWEGAHTPQRIRVRGAWGDGAVEIRGVSLIDERTDVFQPLVLSDRGRFRLVHSGDVKIYENLDLLSRAFFVPQAIAVPDDEAALAAMRDPAFDPAQTVVLAERDGLEIDPAAGSGRAALAAETEIVHYGPERVAVDVVAPSDGWLVLSDAWYPDWKVRVDGEAATLERANVLFRAVAVPAGEHRVEWVYRPRSFRLGGLVSAGSLALLLVVLGWRVRPGRFRG